MGIFDALRAPDINQGVAAYRSTQGAVLLDVRTPEEYHEGHIAGSINIPLQNIRGVQTQISSFDTPIFAYCASGARSAQAAQYLHEVGYTNVTNIGGIHAYRGEIVT